MAKRGRFGGSAREAVASLNRSQRQATKYVQGGRGKDFREGFYEGKSRSGRVGDSYMNDAGYSIGKALSELRSGDNTEFIAGDFNYGMTRIAEGDRAIERIAPKLSKTDLLSQTYGLAIRRIDSAVKRGNLSQEKADRIKQRLYSPEKAVAVVKGNETYHDARRTEEDFTSWMRENPNRVLQRLIAMNAETRYNEVIRGGKEALDKVESEHTGKSLEKAVASIAMVIGGIVGLFFLSNNLTGNVISNLSKTTSNVIGAIFLLGGITGAFFWFRKK